MKVLYLKSHEKKTVDYSGKVIYDNGDAYYMDGHFHCEFGPAITYHDGTKRWYLSSVRYSQEEWFNKLTPEQKIIALFNEENW